MSALELAIQLAAAAHNDQTDKAGQPYILHPLRVMLAMATEEERLAAVLHDVLEDCRDITIGDLRDRFGDRVVSDTLRSRYEKAKARLIEPAAPLSTEAGR